MTVTVERVTIPAWSTVGYGFGHDEAGNAISFFGDHRPMRAIGEAINEGEEPVVELPLDVILEIEEPL